MAKSNKGTATRASGRVVLQEGEALTNGDSSNHWGNNDGQRHSSGDHQVPLVVGDIFALVAVVDLTEGSRVSVSVGPTNQLVTADQNQPAQGSCKQNKTVDVYFGKSPQPQYKPEGFSLTCLMWCTRQVNV